MDVVASLFSSQRTYVILLIFMQGVFYIVAAFLLRSTKFVVVVICFNRMRRITMMQKGTLSRPQEPMKMLLLMTMTMTTTEPVMRWRER